MSHRVEESNYPSPTNITGQSSKSPETFDLQASGRHHSESCKAIWMKYFVIESLNAEKGVTNVLQKFRTLYTTLTAMVDRSLNDVASTQWEEDIYLILHQMVSEFNGKYPISTFEFAQMDNILGKKQTLMAIYCTL
ncbi:E3 ubiquitin-protein ligase UPL4 [Abeliophyllum distichum]|uniref:E3 ubiquitin-protein ligase UPL4 n=1 Tax=Abeliophyllum distichum TaxID=126358 RepID=A0ABD1Q5H7_9LAMI